VSQQLDSYDEFVGSTMQEVVNEAAPIEVFPEPQGIYDEAEYIKKKYSITFGQLIISPPQFREKEGDMNVMYPNQARLRNLTYSAPLWVDVTKQVESIGSISAILRHYSSSSHYRWLRCLVL